MAWKDIGTVTKQRERMEDMPKAAPHGLTMTDGQTSTSKVVNVTTLKQAIWINSKLQAEKPANSSTAEWRQIVMLLGTETIISDLPRSSQLSPLEIIQKWPGQRTQTLMKREINKTSMMTMAGETNEDARFRIAFGSPASKDTIIAHLMRLAALKPIKGTNKISADDGDVQTSFIVLDYTARLLEDKVREVDLFIALEHFIEDDDSDFFPSYAKIKKRIK